MPTRRPVPRWARRAAHLIALCTIPSALWRIGIILGVPIGYDQAWINRSELDTTGGTAYLLFLCVLSEALALLAFGLVSPWGETCPRWTGPLAGKPIPCLLAVVPAALGSLALCAIWTIGVPYAAVTGTPFDPAMTTGPAVAVQLVAYAPMVVWGPLLAALTRHYWVRRVSP